MNVLDGRMQAATGIKNRFKGSENDQLRFLSESQNPQAENMKHFDGMFDMLFSDDINTGPYKPFCPPPPPKPMTPSESMNENFERIEASQQKSYTTVLTILESTNANGTKTYTATTSPIVTTEDLESPTRQPSRMHFLGRMKLRQKRWEEYRSGLLENAGGNMYTISVKRQRKLKMKKHKYKKLMKRTRNLRRRLDRN